MPLLHPNPNLVSYVNSNLILSLRRDAAFSRCLLKACNSRATLFICLPIDVKLYIDVQKYVPSRIFAGPTDLRLQSALSVSRSLSTRSLFQHFQCTKTAFRAPPSIIQSGATAQASRFSSTAFTASTASTTPVSSSATEPVAVPAVPFDDFNTSSIEELTSDLPLIPEQIGYLKDLGLDFGWGPTAFAEYLLEHIHVYTATPWWASIVLAALFVRLALLKPYVGAADVSGRMLALAEVQKPIKARMDAARAARDSTKLLQATNEMQALYQQAGIRTQKLFVPALQLPIGLGVFRLLRRMSELPVPGLEDGGFLWVKDLTMSDPYYILPALTGLSIYYTVKVVSDRQS